MRSDDRFSNGTALSQWIFTQLAGESLSEKEPLNGPCGRPCFQILLGVGLPQLVNVIHICLGDCLLGVPFDMVLPAASKNVPTLWLDAADKAKRFVYGDLKSCGHLVLQQILPITKVNGISLRSQLKLILSFSCQVAAV